MKVVNHAVQTTMAKDQAGTEMSEMMKIVMLAATREIKLMIRVERNKKRTLTKNRLATTDKTQRLAELNGMDPRNDSSYHRGLDRLTHKHQMALRIPTKLPVPQIQPENQATAMNPASDRPARGQPRTRLRMHQQLATALKVATEVVPPIRRQRIHRQSGVSQLHD